jgi:hypothetical protein
MQKIWWQVIVWMDVNEAEVYDHSAVKLFY